MGVNVSNFSWCTVHTLWNHGGGYSGTQLESSLSLPPPHWWGMGRKLRLVSTWVPPSPSVLVLYAGIVFVCHLLEISLFYPRIIAELQFVSRMFCNSTSYYFLGFFYCQVPCDILGLSTKNLNGSFFTPKLMNMRYLMRRTTVNPSVCWAAFIAFQYMSAAEFPCGFSPMSHTKPSPYSCILYSCRWPPFTLKT